MAVIETQLSVLEMQRGLATSHVMKLRQPMFGMAPKRLDAVDVSAALDEFVAAVIDPKGLVQTQINQPVAASPAVGVDDAVGSHFAPNNGLQRGLGGIGNDLGIDTAALLEQSKDDGFATRATPTFAPDTLGAERGLIGLKLA